MSKDHNLGINPSNKAMEFNRKDACEKLDLFLEGEAGKDVN